MKQTGFNSLKAELNAICHLLLLLGDHHILHVSRIRVNGVHGNHFVVERDKGQMPGNSVMKLRVTYISEK
jgi:hypothetical protein